MIWDPRKDEAAHRDRTAARAAAEILACAGKDLKADGESLKEVAQAVAAFLDAHGRQSGNSSQVLLMLASQALSAMGEARAARRLYLFGSGMVRPAEWIVTGNDKVWELDLKHMTMRQDDRLELTFFNGLMTVLDAIADVWDETGGQGVLGLRHVCAAADGFLGVPHMAGRLSMTNEIIARCQHKLSSMATQRGWQATPRVMSLDL